MAEQWNAISQNIASVATELFEHDGYIWSVNSNGKLYKFDGLWTEKASKYESAMTTCAGSHNDKIYAGTNVGTLLEWDNINAWVEVAAKNGLRDYVNCIYSYSGILYSTAYYTDAWGGGGTFLYWNGSAWVVLGGTGIPGKIINVSGFFWVSFGFHNGSGGFVKMLRKWNDETKSFGGSSSAAGNWDPTSALVLGNDYKIYSLYENGLQQFNTNLTFDLGTLKDAQSTTSSRGIAIYKNAIWYGGGGTTTRRFNFYDAETMATSPLMVRMLVFENRLYGAGTTGILYIWGDPTKQYYNIADTWKRGIYSMVNIADDWKLVRETYHSLSGDATIESVGENTIESIGEETLEYQQVSWRS